MKRDEVMMKMHNDNGTLYRTSQEKAPYRQKRKIFIPTTGLNNIELRSPLEKMITEAAEEVAENVKETVEAIVETKNMIDGFVNGIKARAKRERKTFLSTAFEGLMELAESFEGKDGA